MNLVPPDKGVASSDDVERKSYSISARKHELDDAELIDPVHDTLHRGLKARQISMIALGGAIGTGLIIGSGTALARSGPLGLLLGYIIVGFICYLVMVALGEMAAYMPHKKGLAGYVTRFADPALGFALGWNYLMKYLIVTPNNINAAGAVMQYWTTRVPLEAWMSTTLLKFVVILLKINPKFLFGYIVNYLVFTINLLGVRVFGEVEFWFSSVKVISLIGFLLLGIIIDLGGGPKHDRIGFRYWDHPYGPMAFYLLSQVHNKHLSIFLGFWSTLTNALFAYIGTELVGVTAGEAQNPRRNIPVAIRRTFYRILVFYVGGVFVIGLTVPSTNNSLFTANKAPTGAAASPFVVATTLAGIKVLNHVINAAILVFVLSAANSDLYIGSRTLYSLALERKAPRIFTIVNKRGVPCPALIFCTLFCALVFLNVKTSSGTVFTYFVNLVSTFGAITWVCIAFAHIRFMKALKFQNIRRSTLPYKAPLQPFGSWFALISTCIITLFKGFDSFLPFKTSSFVTSYIALPTFFCLWFGYKIWFHTKLFSPSEIDIFTGKKNLDEEEHNYILENDISGSQSKWARIVEKL